MKAHTLKIRYLDGLQAYEPIWRQMQAFTDQRGPETPDELWVLEHLPVYTQGQAGRPEHLLVPGEIPVVQTDRGGQITYHGPGQLVIYILVNLQAKGLTIRDLVRRIEQSVIDYLAGHKLQAVRRIDAPGVYINDTKICALGLKVRRGASYHGLSFNVNMDLRPFESINPCGYSGLKISQLSDFIGPVTPLEVAPGLIHHLVQHLETLTPTLSHFAGEGEEQE